MCWPRSIKPTSVRAQAVPRHVRVILDGNHRHGRQRQLTDPEEGYAVAPTSSMTCASSSECRP
jgi:undecaprenyl pyrophosphate synthase